MTSHAVTLSHLVIQSSPHHINPSQKEAWECQIWIHVEMNHCHTRHSHHKCVPSLWPRNGERYRSREQVHQWWWLGTCYYDNHYHWISVTDQSSPNMVYDKLDIIHRDMCHGIENLLFIPVRVTFRYRNENSLHRYMIKKKKELNRAVW